MQKARDQDLHGLVDLIVINEKVLFSWSIGSVNWEEEDAEVLLTKKKTSKISKNQKAFRNSYRNQQPIMYKRMMAILSFCMSHVCISIVFDNIFC